MSTQAIPRTRLPFVLAATTAAVLAMGLAGCDAFGRRGEGPVTSESRQVMGFTRISVSAGIGVTVRIGPAEPIEVRAQSNLLPLIATDVKDGILRIHSTEAFRATERIEIVIVTPTFDGASMSGGSTARLNGLAGDRLAFDLSGGSVVTATGGTTAVTLNASGGSRASLHDLSAKTIKVDLSGGSNATLHASDLVEGSASGGSRATVRGDARLSVASTGGSAVTHE
jgi:putative autotransporter adhesin-like protein